MGGLFAEGVPHSWAGALAVGTGLNSPLNSERQSECQSSSLTRGSNVGDFSRCSSPSGPLVSDVDLRDFLGGRGGLKKEGGGCGDLLTEGPTTNVAEILKRNACLRRPYAKQISMPDCAPGATWARGMRTNSDRFPHHISADVTGGCRPQGQKKKTAAGQCTRTLEGTLPRCTNVGRSKWLHRYDTWCRCWSAF